MIFEEKISSELTDLTDYYEVLDVKRHANSSEIRESYLRIKATYQKDNAALYTLISPAEREEMLRKIEEAYQILSSPTLKQEYDSVHLTRSDVTDLSSPFDTPSTEEAVNVISIDRAPPMESFSAEENPLEAPTTDFLPEIPRFEKGVTTTYQEPVRAPSQPMPTSFSASGTHSGATSGPAQAPQPRMNHGNIPSTANSPHMGLPAAPIVSELDKEIALQTHWTGPLLRKVRIGRGISIEEVTQATKITKAYILAIEEENYTKLPAPVFIRGFVAQMARQLKLPPNDVTHSYMERARQALPDKFKSPK